MVYIKADGRAKYEKVEDVVDNLRAGSVDEVGLLTEQVLDGKRLAATQAQSAK
jgi:biopolymer transport protein ExbD